MIKKMITLFILLFSINALAVVNIEIHTSFGLIKAELYNKRAPLSVKNFIDYAKSGHYNGTIFHRVINNFMIQGGGYDTNLQLKKTKPPIKNEAANGLKNTIGTLAMARTPNPDSATSQFFINVADNTFLNHTNKSKNGYGYAVFGKVKSISMPIIGRMKSVQVKKNGPSFGHLPTQNMIIKSIVINKK